MISIILSLFNLFYENLMTINQFEKKHNFP